MDFLLKTSEKEEKLAHHFIAEEARFSRILNQFCNEGKNSEGALFELSTLEYFSSEEKILIRHIISFYSLLFSYINSTNNKKIAPLPLRKQAS